MAAISKGGSSTMVRADSSNADNDSILKQQQQQQQPLQLQQQPKAREYTLIAQDTTLQMELFPVLP